MNNDACTFQKYTLNFNISLNINYNVNTVPIYILEVKISSNINYNIHIVQNFILAVKGRFFSSIFISTLTLNTLLHQTLHIVHDFVEK